VSLPSSELTLTTPPPESECVPPRVSSKWKKYIFGSNRNKPKQDLFRVCFGLFRETKKHFFRFVSVFRTFIETTETNKTVSKRTETIRNFLKYALLKKIKTWLKVHKNDLFQTLFIIWSSHFPCLFQNFQITALYQQDKKLRRSKMPN
jgi:hypothetical protein